MTEGREGVYREETKAESNEEAEEAKGHVGNERRRVGLRNNRDGPPFKRKTRQQVEVTDQGFEILKEKKKDKRPVESVHIVNPFNKSTSFIFHITRTSYTRKLNFKRFFRSSSIGPLVSKAHKHLKSLLSIKTH